MLLASGVASLLLFLAFPTINCDDLPPCSIVNAPGCIPSLESTLAPGQTFCCNSSSECFPESFKCNGRVNCPDAEDELESVCGTPNCLGDQVQCAGYSTCTPTKYICDGGADCPFATDELHCNSTCLDSQFNCVNSTQTLVTATGTIERPLCIPATEICNGQPACTHSEDETVEVCGPPACNEDYRPCGDYFKCILPSQFCDGSPDCPLAVDESDCSTRTCAADFMKCKTPMSLVTATMVVESIHCVPITQQCNGIADCMDGSDETNCESISIDEQQFLCKSPQQYNGTGGVVTIGQAVSKKFVCDGDPDCYDGSDEVNCVEFCDNATHFLCNSSVSKLALNGQMVLTQKCISSDRLCNFHADCADRTDEDNCPKQNCSANGFQCPSGQCIQNSQLCNGFADCIDSSADETNCTAEFCAENGRLKCSIDSICIDAIERCDRKIDCTDGSDEINCTNYDCYDSTQYFVCTATMEYNLQNTLCREKGELFCPSFDMLYQRLDHAAAVFANAPICVFANQTCNRVQDCISAEDEANCTTYSCPTVNHKTFVSCDNGTKCVDPAFMCDYENDCEDGTDEQNCLTRTCRPGATVCHDLSKCFIDSWRCDGGQDCPDGSDELDCANMTTPAVQSPEP